MMDPNHDSYAIDYNELIIQLGYITLFSPLLSFAPLLTFIYVWMLIPLEIYNGTHFTRRMKPVPI